MSNDTRISMIGNLVADPELRFTGDGTAVARFRVAAGRSIPDGDGGWRDGEPTYLTCTAWRQQAEHIAESLRKGHRVLLLGRLQQRSWDGPDGQRRTALEVDVDEVGPSLRSAAAAVRPPEPAAAGAAR